jgi:nicotinate-nucleotide adenylyltransferase
VTAPPRIGLYGGSFDPIHIGHLVLARDALEQLKLKRIIFLPAKISPHKLSTPPAPAEVRLEMLEASIAGDPEFSVDNREIAREGPSYTIDTVRAYREQYPDAELFYLIGDDNLPALHTWREISELQRLVRFVVLSRKTAETPDGFPAITRRIELSSSEIRKRVAVGASVRYMVPMPALEILERRRLYREEVVT